MRRSVRAAAAALVVALGASPVPTASAAPIQDEPAVVEAEAGDLVVSGHGWGHRRGLGQYGSLGYAIDHGWSTAQIVGHFYGGTTASTVDPEQEMTVRITSHDERALEAQVDSGGIATYVPGGAPVAGTGRAVRVEETTGGFRVADGATCAGPWAYRTGTVAGTDLRVRAADVGLQPFAYGAAGDSPLSGDWDGDGVDTAGIWRDGVFHLTNARSGGPAQISFRFGTASDEPVVGDWNGDGVDTIGIRRANVLHLRNSNSGGAPNTSFGYGVATDDLVVGDWNADRVDTVGIRRGATWHLRNSNRSGASDISFSYGTASDVAFVGDWNGDRRDGVGVRRSTTWHLRDALSSGPATRSYAALGDGAPVIGHWGGTQQDFVGVVNGNTWELASNDSGGGAAVLLDGDNEALERTLQLCHATSAGGWSAEPSASRYYRGELRAIRSGTSATDFRVVNSLGLDWYVRGVVPRESPAYWGTLPCADGRPSCGQRALEAQTIAARSYSLGENRHPYARTCDTITCQVYGGRAYRPAGGSVTVSEAAQTNSAVAATPGVIRRMSNGSVARTEFSSSTGGWTAGGVYPSVVDDGDDVAQNPNHRWTTTITASQLQSRYGLGVLVAATVTSRSTVDGRAVTGLRLNFAGGQVTTDGEAFRREWGLRSSWFDLAAVSSQPPPADRVGVRQGNAWYLRYALSSGNPDVSFGYGVASDSPVVGDWDGDGVDTPGIRRGATWMLRNANSAGAPDVTFDYGAPAATPLVGDWNGDAADTVGTRDGTVWSIRNANDAGAPTVEFSYGVSSDVPVSGDWDGDGTDTPGIYRAGTFHLRNTNSSGVADRSVSLGLIGTPVVGDWDGNGTDDLGVRVGNVLRLRRSSDGAPMADFGFGGTGDDVISGRWR